LLAERLSENGGVGQFKAGARRNREDEVSGERAVSPRKAGGGGENDKDEKDEENEDENEGEAKLADEVSRHGDTPDLPEAEGPGHQHEGCPASKNENEMTRMLMKLKEAARQRDEGRAARSVATVRPAMAAARYVRADQAGPTQRAVPPHEGGDGGVRPGGVGNMRRSGDGATNGEETKPEDDDPAEWNAAHGSYRDSGGGWMPRPAAAVRPAETMRRPKLTGMVR
jgi:hypothetical protein